MQLGHIIRSMIFNALHRNSLWSSVKVKVKVKVSPGKNVQQNWKGKCDLKMLLNVMKLQQCKKQNKKQHFVINK